MKNIVLDGREFNTKEGFHQYLKEKLNLPDYYGKNLDALWDCLTGYIELPMTIKWVNFKESKDNLGEYADDILSVFKDAQEELTGKFKIINK